MPLNRVRGQERRFSKTEALRAISLLKERAASGTEELKELANE